MPVYHNFLPNILLVRLKQKFNFFFCNSFPEIPVIPCFLTTIGKAASKCFRNAAVEDIFARAINVFNELSRFVPDVADPPKINKNFWMTKMNFFEFIVDFLVNNNERMDTETKLLMDDIKTVIDCLTPLKVQHLRTKKIFCFESHSRFAAYFGNSFYGTTGIGFPHPSSDLSAHKFTFHIRRRCIGFGKWTECDHPQRAKENAVRLKFTIVEMS